MSTCPERITNYMHDYLDGEISREHERELKQHLQVCANCREHMHQLSDVVAFVKSASHVEAPANFEVSVMSRLPKSKHRAGVQKWLRRHPMLAAAAMFFLLMGASVLGSYSNDQQFSVTKQPNLVVEGQTVIVPEGEIVKGDIVVRNGDILVKGEVDGNITVINGKYMASSAIVSGQVEEIDQAFEWLWYKIKSTSKNIVSFAN